MSALPSVSESYDATINVVLETDAITAICLGGPLDVTNAHILWDHVDRALAGGNDLVLDLSEATFIDSSVIHVLFHAARVAHARNQTIVLQLGTGQHIERTLDICQIERVLPRAHDRAEAVRIAQRTSTAHTIETGEL